MDLWANVPWRTVDCTSDGVMWGRLGVIHLCVICHFSVLFSRKRPSTVIRGDRFGEFLGNGTTTYDRSSERSGWGLWSHHSASDTVFLRIPRSLAHALCDSIHCVHLRCFHRWTRIERRLFDPTEGPTSFGLTVARADERLASSGFEPGRRQHPSRSLPSRSVPR